MEADLRYSPFYLLSLFYYRLNVLCCVVDSCFSEENIKAIPVFFRNSGTNNNTG